MQINSVIPVVTADTANRQTQALLDQLLQAGVFRALVIQRERGLVVLDTAWGRFSGKAPEHLKGGDEILARLQPGRAGHTLQVLEHRAPAVRVPLQQLQQALGVEQSAPRMATFVGHENKLAVLRIDKSSYRIPGPQPFAQGDRLLLTPLDNQQLEIRRIDPRSMLRQALSLLLPQDPSRGKSLDTLAATRLGQALVKADSSELLRLLAANAATPAALKAAPATSAATAHGSAMPNTAAAPAASQSSPSSPSTPANRESLQANDTVERLIRGLASLSIEPDRIDAQALRRVLATLTLTSSSQQPARPVANTAQPASQPPLPGQSTPSGPAMAGGNGPPLTTQLITAIKILRQQPEVLQQVLQQLVQAASSAEKSAARPEPRLIDLDIPLRQELLQQSETLLSQVTTQKAILGMQQESQQPLQLNLALPLQVDQQTRQLSLKIREKKAAGGEQQDSAWEVSLSFEFASLGMITTRLLLQGSRLSAHFWAESGSTKTLIDDNLDQFRQQLVRAGFEPDVLDCFHGSPGPQRQEPGPLADTNNLLDLKA